MLLAMSAELIVPDRPEDKQTCRTSLPSFRNGSKYSTNSPVLTCEVLVSAPSAMA